MLKILVRVVLAMTVLAAHPAHAQFRQDVYHVQQKLNALGFPVGDPDGVAGPKTHAAIIDAAAKYGFAATPEALIEHFIADTIQHRSPLGDGPEMDAIKTSVQDMLKDPFSAQFKDVYRLRSGKVCGLVNGKNSFGAYAGWTPFMTEAVSFKGKFIPGVAFIDKDDLMFSFYHCLMDI